MMNQKNIGYLSECQKSALLFSVAKTTGGVLLVRPAPAVLIQKCFIGQLQVLPQKNSALKTRIGWKYGTTFLWNMKKHLKENISKQNKKTWIRAWELSARWQC